jgi:hypothetical protein
MSHKGRNRDPGRMPREPAVTHKEPTALMEAQLESLKRNPGSELIKAGDKRLQPKADATLKTKFETRPLFLCRSATFCAEAAFGAGNK